MSDDGAILLFPSKEKRFSIRTMISGQASRSEIESYLEPLYIQRIRMGLSKQRKGRVEIHSHIADAKIEEADMPNLNAEIYPGRQTCVDNLVT